MTSPACWPLVSDPSGCWAAARLNCYWPGVSAGVSSRGLGTASAQLRLARLPLSSKLCPDILDGGVPLAAGPPMHGCASQPRRLRTGTGPALHSATMCAGRRDDQGGSAICWAWVWMSARIWSV
jgi:hypothetical protein